MNTPLRLMAALFVAGVLFGAVPIQVAYADCPDGTDNADTITCEGADDADPGTDAGDGDDSVIIMSDATVDGDVNGQAGNDTINVDPGPDRSGTIQGDINGGNGDDSIYNLITVAGDITGGAGNDTLRSDFDTVQGDIVGGTGDDLIMQDRGTVDGINGGAGNDTVYNSGEANVVNTGSGDDYFSGRGGTDTLNLGSGNDTVANYGGIGVIEGQAGDDYIYSLEAGAGTINGGRETTGS